MTHTIIIAGGSGKRLWPKSRNRFPKFMLKVSSKNSLIKETLKRERRISPLESILIITNKEHLSLLKKELKGFPAKNIIAEPQAKNTAAAICLGTHIIAEKDPNGIVFIMPADQLIEESKKIYEVLNLASLIAHIKDGLVTIGIKPTYPATGYGYIKTGILYKRLMAGPRYDIFRVAKFTEKPSIKKAKAFLKSKAYLWNSGMFVGKARVFLEEFKRYKPSIYSTAEKIAKSIVARGKRSKIERLYKKFQATSIDYAVMEKSRRVYVVKADIGWQDIGSWLSLTELLGKDRNNNTILGNHVGTGLKDSVIISDKGNLIATAGLDDIIVVQSGDATLICSKEKADDLRAITELAEKKGLKRYL